MAIPGVKEPTRIAEWAVDQRRTFRVSSWEPGLVTMTVTSTTTGQPVTIQVMRIYLSELDGEKGQWTFNLASKQGQVVMNELLARPDIKTRLIAATRQGRPPKTRWAFEVLP